MDTLEKLALLAEGADPEIDAPCGLKRGEANPLARFISPAVGKGGKVVLLLKILQDNACLFNCGYCGMHASATNPHVSIAPEELASLFIDLHNKKMVSGLFLSSGISGSPNRAMQRMLDTVEILRQGYQFKGYIHMKLMPGCSFEYVEQAVKLADRVSVNLEAPSPERLALHRRQEDVPVGDSAADALGQDAGRQRLGRVGGHGDAVRGRRGR